MFIIRATGADRPYLHLFREISTDNSHSTHWQFTGVRLAARHFLTRDAAATVKAKLVNLMLCSGRLELARSLTVDEATPLIPATPLRLDSPTPENSPPSGESDDAECQSRGLTILKKLAGFVLALVACVLTLGIMPGCSGPKIAAEAAYRSQASSLGAGEVVAGVRVEWN